VESSAVDGASDWSHQLGQVAVDVAMPLNVETQTAQAAMKNSSHVFVRRIDPWNRKR
jgi:hypothetical protein